MKNLFIPVMICLCALAGRAQFAPQAGTIGTTAMHRDSAAFINWASGCALVRGWQDISDPSLGRAAVGDETYVPGNAGNGVVSLGDGGEAVVTFNHPIINGPGFDFAVFENGFVDQTLAPGTAFLELAFVEVSSDGTTFFRFPSECLTDSSAQVGSFEGTFAQKIHNLAGKYIAPFGTPFDLADLDSIEGLNINRITHIRIKDVVGSIVPQYSSRDAFGRVINDPWPTAFSSSGFDLDAIGVIHEDLTQSLKKIHHVTLNAYPNPATVNQAIELPASLTNLQVFTMLGQRMDNFQTLTQGGSTLLILQEPGSYFVKALAEDGTSRTATIHIVP